MRQVTGGPVLSSFIVRHSIMLPTLALQEATGEGQPRVVLRGGGGGGGDNYTIPLAAVGGLNAAVT